MTSDPTGSVAFDAYLDELRVALDAGGIPTRYQRRILLECSSHLLDRADELAGEGLSVSAARTEAIRQFGAAQDVALSWSAIADEVVRARSWRDMSVARFAPNLCEAISTHRGAVISGFGLLAGLLLGPPAGYAADVLLGMMLVLPAAGIVVGACFGFSQGVVLRGNGVNRWRWIGATAVGMCVGVTLGTMVVELLGFRESVGAREVFALGVVGGVTGLIVGIMQWSVLHKTVGRARWWALAMAATCALGFLGGGLSANILLGDMKGLAGFTAFALVCGPLAGTISGAALNRLVTT